MRGDDYLPPLERETLHEPPRKRAIRQLPTTLPLGEMAAQLARDYFWLLFFLERRILWPLVREVGYWDERPELRHVPGKSTLRSRLSRFLFPFLRSY